MKTITLMGALMGSLTWIARRPPTVPVPEVTVMFQPERPASSILATSLKDVQYQRKSERQTRYKHKKSRQQRKKKRGY